MAGELLDNKPLPLPEWVRHWRLHYGHFPEAELALVIVRGAWFMISIISIEDRHYRVHFEDVWCEHCGRNCGPSATPDFVAYAGSDLSQAQRREEFDGLPIQDCSHCKRALRRRQTIWLASKGLKAPNPTDAGLF